MAPAEPWSSREFCHERLDLPLSLCRAVHAPQCSGRLRLLPQLREAAPVSGLGVIAEPCTRGAKGANMHARVVEFLDSGMITYFGNDDPTTRRLMEGILAMAEEHADDKGIR